MRKFSLFLGCIFCVFISGCVDKQSAFMVAPPVSYDVEFNARTADPKLKTYTSNQNCTKGTGLRKGCVGFAKFSRGTVSFSLRNEGNNNQNKCGHASVKWVITRIDASVTGDLNGDETKGNGWGVSLLPWVRKAFFPIKDPGQGILYEESVANGETSVLFMNLNNNVGEKDLWYKVTASSCPSDPPTPTVVKVSDPRVENKGSN